MRGLRILLLAAALVGCCTAEQPASNAELVLSPGDVLFVPPYVVHHTAALTESVSLNCFQTG